jgi:SAM-dependent methyltransferase
MTYTYKLRPDCRLCGTSFDTTGKSVAIHLVGTPPGDKYVPPQRKDEVREIVPLDIMFCHSCGGMQTSAVVDPEYLYRHYLSRPAAVNQGLSDAYRGYAQTILDRFRTKGSNLAVELGSNDGAFSKYLKESGMRTIGVEPARNLAEQAIAAGVETIPEFFTAEIADRIKSQHGEADVVVMNHMFSNVDDAGGMIEAVKRVLGPHGVITLQTFYMADVLDKNLIENFNHEHLSYFYIRSFRSFFERHGLELFEVQKVPAKGGSIRIFVQRKGGPHPMSPTVAATIAEEEATGMHKIETYTSVTRFIAGIRENLARVLQPAKAAGKLIAAYGTSIGATTFTYQYGLGDLIEFYVDDDPYRQGLVSPGYHKPVVSNAKLGESKPDYVVILAPLYADQIMAKNAAYKQAGGTFLKIWPEYSLI